MMKLSPKYLILIVTVLSISYLTIAAHSYAQDYLEEKQKALNMIDDFAEKFCIEVPLESSAIKRELSTEAKVKLNNFLAKILDIELGAGGSYEISEYSGILQKDLVEALKNKSDCKLQIFALLKDEFFHDDTTISKRLPYVFVGESGTLALQEYADEETMYLENVYSTGSKCVKDLSNINIKGEKDPVLPGHIIRPYIGWKCARLLPEIWCFSKASDLGGVTLSNIACYLTENECQTSLSFWKLPVRKDRTLTTPCEPYPASEILKRSKDFYRD